MWASRTLCEGGQERFRDSRVVRFLQARLQTPFSAGVGEGRLSQVTVCRGALGLPRLSGKGSGGKGGCPHLAS